MTILIGVDQGTSGTRAVAFDERLHPVGESYQPAHVSHPQPGWIEKDADETVARWSARWASWRRQLDGEVAAVGLDNEGETVVAWDAETVQPLAAAIVWGCRRRQSIVERLAAGGPAPQIQELSGLPLDPYFSATKIRWLVENGGRLRRSRRRADCVSERSTLTSARDWVTAPAPSRPPPRGRSCRRWPRPGAWDAELLGCTASTPLRCPRSARRPGDLGDALRACRCGPRWSTRRPPWPATAPGAGHGQGHVRHGSSCSRTPARAAARVWAA